MNCVLNDPLYCRSYCSLPSTHVYNSIQAMVHSPIWISSSSAMLFLNMQSLHGIATVSISLLSFTNCLHHHSCSLEPYSSSSMNFYHFQPFLNDLLVPRHSSSAFIETRTSFFSHLSIFLTHNCFSGSADMFHVESIYFRS